MIKAAGLILAKHVDGRLYLLLQRRLRRGRLVYEDFGGRAEATDASPIDTLLREAVEESNGLLDRASLAQRVESGCYSGFYQGKYLFLVLLATAEEQELTDFGEKECHMEIERQVRWVRADEIQKKDLCPRLHHRLFMDQLS
jgi:hypothetical protein